ncbi:alkaline phosphatase D family protein [Paraglaciecola sp.]|uniref:alkaline phosphatase D family protein n=1 Tax=Paraglaciecola sp. TaxID=1920173 RepID=UPI0032634EF2
MKLILSLFLFLLLMISNHAYAIERIAFGSCAKQYEKKQPVWQTIQQDQPDVMLMIGDNVYADVQIVNGKEVGNPVTDPEDFTQAYNKLRKHPGFSKLREQTTTLATWDDHDYGQNDGGATYPLKQASQKAFLDFWLKDKNDPLYQQAGIYYSKIFGDDDRRVQIIMLDTRYHRDDLVRKPVETLPGRFIPHSDTNKTLLGEQQWQWLKLQLQKPAEIRLIVTSYQLVSFQHGWESWGNFPHERQRLYDLITDTHANGVIFMSGDRHFTEISVDKGQLGSKVPYPMWDFTSSGLIQKEEAINDKNTFRVGQAYRTTNYGLIDINWQDTLLDTSIELVAKGETGKELIKQVVLLKDIQLSH